METINSKLNEIKGLTQLPHIGKNYKGTHLLIVGESLYTDRKHKKEYKDKGKLKEIIKKNAIDKEVKLFKNLNRTIMGTEGGYNTQAIWENVAYCEFVPRIMNYTYYAEQPTGKDFKDGKKIFERIIDILKPRCCLFLGVRAIDFLGGEKMDKRYNHVLARQLDYKEVKCIAIKHPSSFFSWKKWSEFLVENESIAKIIKKIRKDASADTFVKQHFNQKGKWEWSTETNYLIFREKTSDENIDLYAEFDFNIMEMSYGFAVRNEKENGEETYKKLVDKHHKIEGKFQHCGYSDGWLLFSDDEFSYSNLNRKWQEIHKKLCKLLG